MQHNLDSSPQNIYPCKDNLLEAATDLLDAVPEPDRNAIYALLMCYHNTLIKVLQDEIKTPSLGTTTH